MTSFQTQDWLAQHRQQSRGFCKRLVYFLLRPLLSRKYSRVLSRDTLGKFRPTLCLGARGMPLETRRRWGSKYVGNLRQATLLVQGTGTGWDVISWARLRPGKIIAVDLFPFEESWGEITRYCQVRYRVEVDFHQSTLENLSFIDDRSIDLIASDAVYEHCRNLPAVMRESFRMLRSGGSLYASYKPLYYCAGGDHFSGRGGLEHSYNHIWLDPEAYRAYVSSFRQEVEDLQAGARFLELGLFSYLTTEQYLTIFREAGFLVKELILQISETAGEFKKTFPDRFDLVVKQNRGKCGTDDLLIQAHLIIMEKPDKFP